MNIVAIIPARGGSKRIPRKNILPLAGVPLVRHTIEQARNCRLVNKVIVSTDDDEIAAISSASGAQVVKRPPEISGDTASSESCLLHALEYQERTENLPIDLVVFLQCTSPLRGEGDIEGAINELIRQQADSLFSACPFNKYIWTAKGGSIEPINYDYRKRWREQDFPVQYMENGSIYVFKPWVLKELKNRIGGKRVVYEMEYLNSFQIDTMEDFQLCEFVLDLKHQMTRRE